MLGRLWSWLVGRPTEVVVHLHVDLHVNGLSNNQKIVREEGRTVSSSFQPTSTYEVASANDIRQIVQAGQVDRPIGVDKTAENLAAKAEGASPDEQVKSLMRMRVKKGE